MTATYSKAEKDAIRAAKYAAKWHAEHGRAEPPRTAEPTDHALTECFAGSVRPAKPELYPRIRLEIAHFEAVQRDREALARIERCSVCGEQIQREDTPLPASWAPVPWWHHMNEAEARACPTTSPVRPASEESTQ